MPKVNKVIDHPTKATATWEQEFARCQPWIEQSLKYQDNYTINDVRDKIGNGSFHLWPGPKSFMVTELVVFPQNRALNIIFCGGDYQELETMLTTVELFARKLHCKRLYGGGRKGWIRKIKHLGFEQDYLLKKEL